ncbi:hypothetical protein [Methylomonas koyamae]|nr:hypothetical protein [Methylomonas koyamae]
MDAAFGVGQLGPELQMVWLRIKGAVFKLVKKSFGISSGLGVQFPSHESLHICGEIVWVGWQLPIKSD